MRKRKWAIEIASMAAIGMVLALMGPFGTFALPFGARVVAWQVFIVGGYCVFRPVVAAGSLVAIHGGIPRWLAIGLACVLAAMPVTVLVGWALGGMAWRGLTLGTLVELYPDILLVGAAITLLQVVAGRGPGAVVEPPDPAAGREQPPEPDRTIEATPEPATQPRFLARLPVGHRDGLIAIESEDHYLRVHNRAGSTLVLMRLADAVAELEGVDGLRTHRSWWVARDAVAEVLRRDRAISLRLVNGIEAPVARNAVSELRAAGWLAP